VDVVSCLGDPERCRDSPHKIPNGIVDIESGVATSGPKRRRHALVEGRLWRVSKLDSFFFKKKELKLCLSPFLSDYQLPKNPRLGKKPSVRKSGTTI
jgi:hypothetical protein